MPDGRHFRDQQYCTKGKCRHASKLASHRHWYYSEKGNEYRDPEFNKQRVREWRAAHPDYAKLTGGRPGRALQETTAAEQLDNKELTTSLVTDALQDMNFSQPALAVGLIASLTGTALQDTIAETTRRFVLLGQDILGNGPGSAKRGDRRYADNKTDPVPGAPASCSESLQLD